MRLREIVRYELEHRLRSASTWIYPGYLFLVAIWMFLATADGGSSGHFNAPERIAGGSVLVGMFGMLVTAALFGDAAVRDVAAGMDPLLYTSPLRKTEYLGGRFLAAWAVNAVVLVAVPLGFLAATALVAAHEPGASEALGPFRVAAFAQAYLLFLLPNLALVGALLFTIAALSRQVLPAYLGAIGLFLGSVVAINYASEIEGPVLAALVDPTGIGALQSVTRYWTEAERNTRLVGFPAALVWNRVVWLAVAAGVLSLLVRSVRFTHADDGGRRRRARPVDERSRSRAEAAGPAPVAVPRVAGTFGVRTATRQALSVAREALAESAANRWFAAVLLACAGLTMLFGWNVGDTVFDTSTWPVTFLVAETVLSQRTVPIYYMLITLYAGALVWTPREVGAAEFADAAPVTEGVALLGRLLALVVMLAMFQAASMLGGLLIQALQGYTRFEPGLYLAILFGLNLADHVLLAVLAVTIHVVVNHKYLGHLVALTALVSAVVLEKLGIVRHHLLLYGSDPGWTYSDMNGFGPFLGPFVWFKLYWAAWALLLAVLAGLFLVRGQTSGLRGRLGQARARLSAPVLRAAGVALALIVGLGGFIFYNTNVLNDYRSPEDAGRRQAAYERRYRRFEASPQPVITAAELRVEIYPEQTAVDTRGSFALTNRTGAAIDAVHVSFMDPEVQARELSLDRDARLVLADDEVGFRIYALDRALAPGDSLQLAFAVTYRPRGFPNSGIATAVARNGSSFNRKWLPFVGYQPAFELSGEDERRRLGLEPRAPMPGPDDAGARRYRHSVRDADLVDVDMILGTSEDQIAITPGALRRSWTENGRRYYHYRTDAPTSFSATVFSAAYAVLEDRWKDVALRIYYHPTHDYVLDRTLRSMKSSLEYYTGHFGPYPEAELRVVEIPRYGGFGVAHPHTIAFTEDYFFSRVRDGEVDLPFYGTAHEIAHQWWGGQARGAQVRGHAFLSESLANYSAMMVTEKEYGPAAAREVYDFQMERYLHGRATQSREVPLLEVTDQPYIAYRKGAIAMYTLREQIGEERVDAALRRYLEQHREGGPPYPTSLDLYAELRAVTPDSHQALLKDLFEEVTLWEVRTERARVERTDAGEYQVTLEVAGKKLRADSVGAETEVPMDDLVEVGVFAPGGDDELGAPLYLQQHRVRSGAQTIRVTVAQEPARAGVDPHRKLIDRQRRDNVVDVETAAAPAARGP